MLNSVLSSVVIFGHAGSVTYSVQRPIVSLITSMVMFFVSSGENRSSCRTASSVGSLLVTLGGKDDDDVSH